MAQKSNAKPAVQTIYKEIRERISLLQYPPGTVLSENALAKEFGVSRTPIRRVLQRLEFEGLVESKRSIGTMVTTVDLRSLQEVYAFRMKLHEITGELSSVVRVSGEDIAFLEELLEQVEVMRDQYDPEELARLYNAFQNHVVRFISNKPLREISDQLYYQTSRMWMQILPGMDWLEEVNAICDEIARVIQALNAEDMHMFGQVRYEHLYNMLGRIKRYLGGASEVDLA